MKKKPKMKTLTKFVIFSFVTLIVYTIVSQIMAVINSTELVTLTRLFFATFGGEVLTCAVMKMLKLKGVKHGDSDQITSDLQSGDSLGSGSSEEDDSGIYG